MTERRLTFIDVDENPLVVWLKDDRIQLSVIDSRPELEAGELRRFAVALFATYVGAQLATRLESARKKIGDVRDTLAATAGGDELLAALDGSLNAIEDVHDVITAAGSAIAPDAERAAPASGTPSAPTMHAVATAEGWFKRLRSGRRAGERGGRPGWGNSNRRS
jgi:hypothetical protein